MVNGSDMFLRMAKEALEEMASGEKGWREMDTNVLILACCGILFNHLSHKITKPLWVLGWAGVAVAVGYFVDLTFPRIFGG